MRSLYILLLRALFLQLWIDAHDHANIVLMMQAQCIYISLLSYLHIFIFHGDWLVPLHKLQVCEFITLFVCALS